MTTPSLGNFLEFAVPIMNSLLSRSLDRSLLLHGVPASASAFGPKGGSHLLAAGQVENLPPRGAAYPVPTTTGCVPFLCRAGHFDSTAIVTGSESATAVTESPDVLADVNCL
jgi:hypothetical protein